MLPNQGPLNPQGWGLTIITPRAWQWLSGYWFLHVQWARIIFPWQKYSSDNHRGLSFCFVKIGGFPGRPLSIETGGVIDKLHKLVTLPHYQQVLLSLARLLISPDLKFPWFPPLLSGCFRGFRISTQGNTKSKVGKPSLPLHHFCCSYKEVFLGWG